jgi:hypothetical protein
VTPQYNDPPIKKISSSLFFCENKPPKKRRRECKVVDDHLFMDSLVRFNKWDRKQKTHGLRCGGVTEDEKGHGAGKKPI